VRFVWLEDIDDAVAPALTPSASPDEAETSVASHASLHRQAARSA